MSTLGRTYSDQYVSGTSEVDYFQNKNANWLDGTGTKFCYMLFLFLTWGFLHLSRWFTPEDCWTVTNVIHTVTTFIFFHWIKGSPEDAQGEYNALTLYEQIDAGVPYTLTKKFLMVIPAYLCWMSCHLSNYKTMVNVVNLGMFALCVIPKIPEMHRVRVLGVNQTIGIDDPVEISASKRGGGRSPRSSARLRQNAAKKTK